MGKDVVLHVHEVSKSFGDQSVLNNINLEITSGEIFGIIGPSGCGKTTLINILTGNLFPDKGSVFFEPKTFTKFDSEENFLEPLHFNPPLLKKTIGYSPQVPSLYDKLSCFENLDLFGSLYQIPEDIKEVNIKILLNLVGLIDFKDKRASDLSGGMRKRLDLACSLIHDPKILILDEPTSDLDQVLRKQMLELIRKINKKGTTVIMSTHFLDEIESLCDRIAIVDQASIKFIGSPRELKAKSETDLLVKILTESRSYDSLKTILKKKYAQAEFVEKDHLHIKIKNVSNITTYADNILSLLKNSKERVIEFSYTSSGIGELFEELTKKDEHHKVKSKLKKIKLEKWKL